MRGQALVLTVLLFVTLAPGCSPDHRPSAVAVAEARFAGRKTPPFPGTSKPDEILANIQFSLWSTRTYGEGFEALFEPGAVTVERLLEVQDPRGGDYLLLEVRRKNSNQVWTFGFRKQTGLMAFCAGCIVPGDSSVVTGIPRIEAVSDQLERRFGAHDAHYFAPPFTNLGYLANCDNPLITARSAKGTIVVNRELVVFEEAGFELDPPELSPEARQQRRAQQLNGRYFIAADDAVMWFEKVGTLGK